MDADTLILKVPAKVNLSLDITGKRADGYHTLRSIFQTVSVYDMLTIRKVGADTPFSLSCNVEGIPCDARNLVTKAAMALLGDAPCGIAMHLEKQIPSQAGMGGGSADCAAALLGLRALLSLPVSDAQLHTIAAKLGADVPFFLMGGTVLAEGIGERLTPLAAPPARILVLAKGNEGVSTPQAYGRIDHLAAPPKPSTDAVLQQLYQEPTDLFPVCANAFDAVTDLEEIRQIRTIMLQHHANPVLSGSGAAVFCGFASQTEAHACAEALRNAKLPFVTVCQTVSHGVVQLTESGEHPLAIAKID